MVKQSASVIHFYIIIVFPLQVETYKSFRPGDIVLAKVVSFDPKLL